MMGCIDKTDKLDLHGLNVLQRNGTLPTVGSRRERCGTSASRVPRVHSSGDKTRSGRTRADVNRYLKWAFVEAANSVALNHERRPNRHVSRLYRRIKRRRDYPKAIGAVARHLAEAALHVLDRQEPYREPRGKRPRGRTRKA